MRDYMLERLTSFMSLAQTAKGNKLSNNSMDKLETIASESQS